MISWLIALIVASGWQDLDSGARALMKEGRLAEAESQWKEAIALAETDKEIDPGVVDCLIGLSGLYDKRGNAAESERLFELAMRTVEGVKGSDSAAYADRLPALAALYRKHGKSWHSELLFQRPQLLRLELLEEVVLERLHGRVGPELAAAGEPTQRIGDIGVDGRRVPREPIERGSGGQKA